MTLRVKQVSDSFTRPADTDSYADGDLVANDTTAGNVVPLKFHVGGQGSRIVGVRLEKTDESDVANADFTVHFFGSSPTPGNGDNGALSTDVADKIGSVDLATMTAFTSNAAGFVTIGDTALPEGLYTNFEVVYALIEAGGAYSPASGEVFTATVTFSQEG